MNNNATFEDAFGIILLFIFLLVFFPVIFVLPIMILFLWDSDAVDLAGNIISNRREIKYGKDYKKTYGNHK